MLKLVLLLGIIFTLNVISKEDEKIEYEGFEYSSLGLDIIQTDSTGVGLKVSIP